MEDIRNTIIHFNQTIAKDKWLLIVLDHALLVKGKSGDAERTTLAELQYMFIEVKKYERNTVIQLSQLNRDIETVERINNAYMHFPLRKDLFGADSLFQSSDYVAVLHRPELIGLKEYGVNKWPTSNLIYMHLLKARDGELGIIVFENILKFNRIDEYELKKDERFQLISPM